MAWLSIQAAKQHLGINPSDNAEDTALSALCIQAQTAIESWCDRQFESDEVTEYYSGNGTPYLFLKRRPVTEIDSVYTSERGYWGQGSNAFSSDTLLTAGTDYVLRIDGNDGKSYSGVVERLNGAWEGTALYKAGVIGGVPSMGRGNIKITYTAGFSEVPFDVKLAGYLLIASIRNSRNYGQLLASESRSDGSGSNSYSLAGGEAIGMMTPEVMGWLSKYRNVAVA